MFTALASSPQVRLSSLTNTQGLPHNRLTYIAFAEFKACMSLLLNLPFWRQVMQTELSQFTAIIGIDWADKKHDICIQVAETGRRKVLQIPHRAEKIDDWARSLYREHGGPIAIALELSKGPIVSALQKYDFFVIFPIDPTTLANYRRTFTLSGAKDDPTDAEYALNLLLTHTEHFKALRPQSVEMRTLMTLVEQRRRLMNDRVRITNRLRNALKQYYPQALEWFDRIDTLLFCDFIKRWPSLAQARRARKATLEKFFREHNMNPQSLARAAHDSDQVGTRVDRRRGDHPALSVTGADTGCTTRGGTGIHPTL